VFRQLSAILTDAFSKDSAASRSGVNAIAAIAARSGPGDGGRGSRPSPAPRLHLGAGGPIAKVWSLRKLVDNRNSGSSARIEWWGPTSPSTSAPLISVMSHKVRHQCPYGGHPMGWKRPLGSLDDRLVLVLLDALRP